MPNGFPSKLPPFSRRVCELVRGEEYVDAADVLAVAYNESGYDPTFQPTEQLFQLNLKAAEIGTTLPGPLLTDALKIQSGTYKGQLSKFRFEPSYWEWSATQKLSSVTERFLVSCSFGVGQQMMRWILPPKKEDWLPFVQDFQGNLDKQLIYLIGNMKTLLIQQKGDLKRAYRAYNSGNANSKNPEVNARALRVCNIRDIVVKQLKGL